MYALLSIYLQFVREDQIDRMLKNPEQHPKLVGQMTDAIRLSLQYRLMDRAKQMFGPMLEEMKTACQLAATQKLLIR